jgi:hypothetical protein
MSVSSELLCSFELLKPLDSNALKSHIKKGRTKRNNILNSPVSILPLASWRLEEAADTIDSLLVCMSHGACDERLQSCCRRIERFSQRTRSQCPFARRAPLKASHARQRGTEGKRPHHTMPTHSRAERRASVLVTTRGKSALPQLLVVAGNGLLQLSATSPLPTANSETKSSSTSTFSQHTPRFRWRIRHEA